MAESFSTAITHVELHGQCARRYYYEKICGEKREEGIDLVVGKFYHECFADLGRLVLENFEIVKFAPVVQRHLAKYEEAMTKLGVDVGDLHDEAYANLCGLWSFFGEDKLYPIEHVEGVPLIERWFDSNKIGYRGKIDLCSRNFPIVSQKGTVKSWTPMPCVVDFKVLTSSRRKTERDAMRSAQLACYCAETDLRHAAFCEIPRNLEKPIQFRTVQYTDQEIAHWDGWLREQQRALAWKHFLVEEGIGDDASKSMQMTSLFPRCSRSEPLCAPLYCPHYMKCYPCQQSIPEPGAVETKNAS